MHDHHHAQSSDAGFDSTQHANLDAPSEDQHLSHHVTTATVYPHRQPGDHAGHGDQHAGHSEARFARLFWIALILTVPVIFYSDLLQRILGYTAPAFTGSGLIAPVLASVIYWYTGWIFLSGAFAELRERRPGMMTLVALAITSAYVYSLAVSTELLQGMPFYWELATLVTIMLLGHWMELRAIGSAQSALKELAKLLPDTAVRIVGDRTEEVPVSELRPDDLLLVRPGARIPADGTVADGRSQVDESMITGESRPVDKTTGSPAIGGTVNGSGSLRIRVSQTGEKTMLAGIMQLVREAQSSRTRAQALADRAAFWLTIVAVLVATVAFVGWTLARGLTDYTIERTVTTLVVACPHALGLAIPLVIAISTALSARSGILVRDRMALERARNLKVVVFDKTGTLTKGEQGMVAVTTADGLADDAAIALAAALEGDSEHPIAKAIGAAAVDRGLNVPQAGQFEALPGRGVQAVVDGRELRIGGPRLLGERNVALSPDLAAETSQWGERGQSVIYLVEGDRALAAFALSDVIRPESREAISDLKKMGVRVAMLTGDSEDVAQWVASDLGIDEYFAGVLPRDKNAKIRDLQRDGTLVAMVGDGVNDAPALAQADVGIAIGAGTDVAVASAGIVLIRNDPRDVARIIRLSRATYRKMVQNLVWAVGYNAIALPLAAGALAGVGVVMPVWVGAVLMSLSTIIVALNAQTLRRLDLGTDVSAQALRQPNRRAVRP